MAVKAKKMTRAKKAKNVKKPAAKTAAKKAKTRKNHASKKIAKKAARKTAKKTAKKTVAKKSRAAKTIKQHKQQQTKPAKQSVKNAANKPVTKRPSVKTTWKISPEISQSALTIDTWKKDDLKIEFLKVYRSGWIVVNQLPDLSAYNPDEGINIFEELQFDEHQLYDGSQETSIFPNELLAEERGRLLGLSEEELADEGWTLESVTRFKGPLLVEEV
jgi:hypothetical protein